jgi:hypothetical protein
MGNEVSAHVFKCWQKKQATFIFKVGKIPSPIQTSDLVVKDPGFKKITLQMLMLSFPHIS